MARFEFEGHADVTVYLTVEADSLEDARSIADSASDFEWKADSVDGTVTSIICTHDGVREA